MEFDKNALSTKLSPTEKKRQIAHKKSCNKCETFILQPNNVFIVKFRLECIDKRNSVGEQGVLTVYALSDLQLQ